MNKEILRLGVPAIVSNITVPLLGLCDTAISGHLGSEIYLAAIAVGAMMLNVIICLLVFLRMGTTGMTATVYGAGDNDGIRRIFTRALILGTGFGVALILLQYPLMQGMLAIIDPEPEVRLYVERYFILRIWGMPALLGMMAVSGWFVGMQSTVPPMVISITMNIINILLSYLLVFHTSVGFEGVAWGTMASNWAGFIMALIWARRFRSGERLLCRRDEILRGGGMRRFFTVNANLFFRSIFVMAVSMGVTAAGARLGALTLAVNVIMMQFFQFFSYFMDGFAFAGEALTGRFAGAGDPGMLRRSVRALLLWTGAMGAVFSLLYLFGGDAVTALLTDSDNVREGVDSMMVWVALLPICSAWAFIFDGFYVGITDTAKMMLATLCASLLFYLLAWMHIADGTVSFAVVGNTRLWTAFLAYLLLRGVVLAALWPRSVRVRMSGAA